MVRSDVIQKRLAKMEEYLAFLENMAKTPLGVFLSDPEKYGSSEHFLQLSIEALIDMGNHLIADKNLGIVDASGDIPRILHEKGYLSDALETTWIRMIGFRNILVHDYLDVDHRLVYAVLQEHLDDVKSLMRVFADLI